MVSCEICEKAVDELGSSSAEELRGMGTALPRGAVCGALAAVDSGKRRVRRASFSYVCS